MPTPERAAQTCGPVSVSSTKMTQPFLRDALYTASLSATKARKTLPRRVILWVWEPISCLRGPVFEDRAATCCFAWSFLFKVG